MFQNTLKILALGLLFFCIGEQTYRVYVVGLDAFNPYRFNRINQILHTNFIEPAEYPSVAYQLKPGLDEWYMGADLQTNDFGLADREYRLEKDPGTIRVAVIGSSWTMATGVATDESYHAVLETMLNEQYPGRNFEFLNFGVELYGLGEMLGTLRHRVPPWQPDMIVSAITAYTPTVLWEERDVVPALPEPTTPFFESYVLRAFDNFFQTGFYASAGSTRPAIDSAAGYQAQIMRAITEIGEVAEAAGVPAMVMWLSFSSPGDVVEAKIRKAADESGVQYVPAYRWIVGKQDMQVGTRVGRMHGHPDAASHRLLAEGLFAEFEKHKLLAGAE